MTCQISESMIAAASGFVEAVRREKASVALDYIARKEQFEVTEEAVEERVNTYIYEAGKDAFL